MKGSNNFSVLFCLCFLAGCSARSKSHEKISPAHIEKSGEIAIVVLTSDAQKRLGVAVETVKSDGKYARVPASSILYDTHGATWIYVESGEFKYRRRQVKLVRIQNQDALVEKNLPEGTRCVSEGAAELYGTESGVGK
jgi:hypothetical protein